MAYLAFDMASVAQLRSEAGGGGCRPIADAVPALATVPASSLTPLEWSVVSLARRDSIGSLDRPGRWGSLLRAWLRSPNPMLADPRLEALRRMAVLTWHYGFTVPTREVADFLAAGFSSDQYEAMAVGIGNAQQSRPRV